MSDPRKFVSTFADRFSLAALSDGQGVLIDLHGGAYFRLNRTASTVCQILGAASTLEDALDRIVKKMALTIDDASKTLASVQAELSQDSPRSDPGGPLRYVRQNDGSWALQENRRTILSIAEREQLVRLHVAPNELSGPLAFYLQALVPKLLTLVEVPVLHAASCQIGGRYVAFSGKSGAGKTTTARAFERAGALFLSEDLLVLSLTGQRPGLYVGGEAFARSWARTAAPALVSNPDNAIGYSVLSDAGQGDVVPLDAIWFLAPERRNGADFEMHRLGVSDGMLTLLETGLLATSQPRHWRDFFHRSQVIAEKVVLHETTAPQGLAALESAASRYIVNSAS